MISWKLIFGIPTAYTFMLLQNLECVKCLSLDWAVRQRILSKKHSPLWSSLYTRRRVSRTYTKHGPGPWTTSSDRFKATAITYCHLGWGSSKGLKRVMLSGNLPPPRSRFVQNENWIHSWSPIKFTSWNENIGGRNALDLYLKTSLWSSHLWGAIPKQPAITRQTLKDVSNKYESVFLFIPWPPVNFHINKGDFLLKIRGGPWGGPWTSVHVLYSSLSRKK